MAYVRAHETRQKRKGKVVKTYAVVWREPVRDQFGLPMPVNPEHPDGPKQMRARRETYPTREAAEARRDELNAARHTTGASALAEQRKAGDMPFGYYVRAWLDAQGVRVASGKLKAATCVKYQRLLEFYVLPELGATAVAAISPAHCEQLLMTLVNRRSRVGAADAALSPQTVTHVWRTFSKVMRYAMHHGAITANPADRVDFSASRATGDRARFEHRPLTAEQVGALSAAIAGELPGLPAYPAYALMVQFMAYTGLRAGEVAGLEVGDLTFAPGPRCAVNVRRTKERRGGVWVTGTPKSKRSRRTVPLPAWLAERMADYIAGHPRADEPTALLWPGRTAKWAPIKDAGNRRQTAYDWSEPVDMDTFYRRVFRPALAAVGLPVSQPARRATKTEPACAAMKGVRIHDLRHTFAAQQLSVGVHFMQVSQWLGHASYTLTLDTYGDWIPQQDGGAANALPEPPAPEAAARAVVDNVVNLLGRQTS
ncbi:tyrosine-type recombinase/integrase [Mycobacterium sp.]|uniref:tyrosine-type recombinase/integrase n=1 Tax=Mycobacterium sp. TaxID=1785 RepID=UPI003F9BB676